MPPELFGTHHNIWFGKMLKFPLTIENNEVCGNSCRDYDKDVVVLLVNLWIVEEDVVNLRYKNEKQYE